MMRASSLLRLSPLLALALLLAALSLFHAAPAEATHTTATPTNLQAQAGNQQVTLTWEAGSNEINSYVVQYGEHPSGTLSPQTVSNSATVTITGLTNGTTYRFRVKTGTPSGHTESAWTDFVTATPAVLTPGAPTNLSVTPGDAKLDLSWTAPSGTVTGYDVHYTASTTVAAHAAAVSNAATGWVAHTRSATLTTATHSVTGLTNDTPYRVRVRAKNAGGAGPWVTSDGAVWQATLTVAAISGSFGCSNNAGAATSHCTNQLTSTTFLLGSNPGTRYEVTDVQDYDSGSLWVAFDRTVIGDTAIQALQFCIGASGYAMTNAVGATTFGLGNLDLQWSAGDKIPLSIGTTCAQQTHTPTQPQSSNADLSALTATSSTSASGTFSALTLNPSPFAAATTAYTASVANSITHVKLRPTVAGSNATVEVGKGSSLSSVTSGQDSAAISLSVGANAITVKVTAQDGSTTKTYTVTVTRQSPQSSDANLSGLTATSSTSASGTFSALALSPSTFAAARTSYTASVANARTHVKLRPTTNDSNATVEVGKGSSLTAVTSGQASGAISLSVGANAITVRVTAPDGSTTKTYTVTVTRAQGQQSTNADLSGLTASASTSASGTFSALTLSPSAFAAATTAYTASVENDRTHVKLTPTASDSNATVEVGKGSNLTAVTSGSASAAIALSLGANAITVKVTAQDGSTTKTYTVTVTRAAPIVSLSTALVETVEGASSAVVRLTIDPVLVEASSVRLVLNDPAAPGRLRGLPRTVALPAGTASVNVDLSANLPADNAVNGHNSGTALRLEAVNNAPYVVGSPQVLQLYVIDNDPPAAPLLISTPGDWKLTAEWTRPAGPVQRYELRYKQTSAADRAATTANDPSTGWVTLTHAEVPLRPGWTVSPRLREITGLMGWTAYHLQVRANDGHSGAGNGWGGWSRLKTDTAYRGYTDLWSSTLTVKDLGHLSGDGCNGQSQCSAQLSSSSSFTYGGGRYNVLAVRVVRGSLQLLLDRPLSVNGGSLRLDVGGQRFRYKDASVSWGIERNEDAWRLTWHGTGLSWTDGDTVSLSLESNAPVPPTPAPHTDLHPVRVHYDEMRDGEPVNNFNSMRVASPNPSTIPGTFERRVELRAYIPGTFGSADPEQGIVTTTHVMLRVRAHLDSTLAWAIGNVYGVTGSFAAFDNGGYTPAIALNPASKWTYVYIRVTNGSQVATHLVAIDPPPRTYTLTPEARVAEGEEAALTLSLGSPAGAGGVSFTVSADYPDGGATAEDVGQFATSVTVPEGQQSARIIIPTVDDQEVEEDEERFSVRGAHVGEPAWAVDPEGTDTAVVTIVDNDEPPQPPAPPEGPEPWDIRVVPGDGTLTVTWKVGSRDGVDDSEIWHVLRWSQEPGVWNNPRDPRAVGKNDGLSVDPGVTSYTITDLENGVATGVFVRSMVGHRNNMSEREGNSSKWVRVKGEHTTPVAPPNAAPTVSSAIADTTIVNESGTHEIPLAGVFSDLDGDALTVTASSSDESVATVSVAAGYSTLTVSAQGRGTATVTVTAADGKGGSVDDTFTVTIKAAPVVASPIGDISGLEAGDSRTISMAGVFSDANGDAVTVTQASSSDTSIAAVSAAIDGATTAITAVTVIANSEGTATITVTAQDSDGNRVSDAFDVTVNAPAAQQQKVNNAPTVSGAISDATIVSESGTRQVSLSGVFADSDGDGLTVTATSSDENVVTVSVASDQSTLTVSAQARGTATITVTADDGKGGSVEDSFTVKVKAAPVVATAIADVSSLEEGATREVSLSGVFSDADGDSLAVTAASSDEGKAAVSVAADRSALTVSAVAEGTATITVTAQDADGNTVGDAFQVEVVQVPEPEPEPVELPGPVVGLELTATHDSVSVSWSAPESGDAPDGYIVHLKPEDGGKGRTKTPKAKKTKVSFDNLEAGRTYKVWVRAQNEAGKGERVHATITLPEAEPSPEQGEQGDGEQQEGQSGQ